MDKPAIIADEVYSRMPTLVEGILTEQYRRFPDLEQRYGHAGMQRCREDIRFHLGTLAEAMAVGEPDLFLKYIAWGKVVLHARKIRTDDLLNTLAVMQEVITREVGRRAATLADRYLQQACKLFPSFSTNVAPCINPNAPFADLANAYLRALLSVDRNEARKLVLDCVRDGTRVADIYRYVFEPVMRELGRLWQLNHISVAQEHYGTATTETLMSEMLRDREEIDHGPNFFLGACVAGSLHSLGVRMLSDLLESAGWKIYFTGANTPSSSLLDLVNRFRVDVLGISATTPSDIAEVRRLIDAVRKSKKAKTRIMVGGRIFCEFPNLWKTVGADASSIDAISGVKVAQKLAAS